MTKNQQHQQEFEEFLKKSDTDSNVNFKVEERDKLAVEAQQIMKQLELKQNELEQLIGKRAALGVNLPNVHKNDKQSKVLGCVQTEQSNSEIKKLKEQIESLKKYHAEKV